eukprot:Hpha_TRINITY_DN29733_c0_g1::TRINITY_DN29733_c0_g1_i1::g.2528::m.2528
MPRHGSPSPRRKRDKKHAASSSPDKSPAARPVQQQKQQQPEKGEAVPKPAPPACGGDAPDTPYTQDYYERLTKDELVRVVEVPGKGKGMRVTTDIAEDEAVLEESALVVVQNMDDRRLNIPVCPMSFASLETPRETFIRVMTTQLGHAPDVPDLPFHDDYPVPARVPCKRAGKGCRFEFASKALRDKSERGWHHILCRGSMTEEQERALTEFESRAWSFKGVEYKECFYVALHSVALMLADMRLEEKGVEEVWFPFYQFAWLPWIELGLAWAPAETSREEVSEFLSDLHQTIRRVVAPEKEEEEALMTLERLDRLVGLVLLNSQERSPESPWGLYITWLEEKDVKTKLRKGEFDWRAKRPTDNSNKLYYSASGQGIYRVHASSNHSCEPSCEVRYTETMSETLNICALRPMKKGDEVTISYVADVETVSRSKRQKYLATNYRFDCLCSRCEREKPEK